MFTLENDFNDVMGMIDRSYWLDEKVKDWKGYCSLEVGEVDEPEGNNVLSN